MSDSPLVEPNDYGLRNDDRCHYCLSPIGERHRSDCCAVERVAQVNLHYRGEVYRVVVPVPYSWDRERVHDFLNDGPLCLGNLKIQVMHSDQNPIGPQLLRSPFCICEEGHVCLPNDWAGPRLPQVRE
jgi:hypothetical protein